MEVTAMRRSSQAALVGTLFLASGIVCGARAGSPAAADTGTVNAVWVEHDLAFTYMGFTSHYSCSGLEDKVKYVMKQLGARPGFKVTSGGCVNLSGPEVMPRVRVRAALPQEATPEVLAQLEKDRSVRELAARAGGKPLPATDEAAARFPATWRVVTFEGTPISDIQDGDCELLEQLIRNVLKPMGVREVAGSSLNCVPHQVPINAVNVKLQVLSAPQADTPASNTPTQPR
jgi:hypothetical protein